MLWLQTRLIASLTSIIFREHTALSWINGLNDPVTNSKLDARQAGPRFHRKGGNFVVTIIVRAPV
jgi:hypothetical protein